MVTAAAAAALPGTTGAAPGCSSLRHLLLTRSCCNPNAAAAAASYGARAAAGQQHQGQEAGDTRMLLTAAGAGNMHCSTSCRDGGRQKGCGAAAAHCDLVVAVPVCPVALVVCVAAGASSSRRWQCHGGVRQLMRPGCLTHHISAPLAGRTARLHQVAGVAGARHAFKDIHV